MFWVCRLKIFLIYISGYHLVWQSGTICAEMVLRVDLQCVIVVFPDHAHLLFGRGHYEKHSCVVLIWSSG